jgi:hypothetical protein
MLTLWLLGACSADHASEPEPTLETKGAFVAVASDDGGCELLRTLAVIGSGRDDDAFFVVPYDVAPQSFRAARELAKDPTLPTKPVVAIGRRYITSREWQVVWFRSVSAEEEREFR